LSADETALLDVKDNRDRLIKKFQSLGFRRIALDLEGFRSGSMDEAEAGRNCRVLHDGGSGTGTMDD
jgi:PP-loop superfamily ATP-utilizing enzyme